MTPRVASLHDTGKVRIGIAHTAKAYHEQGSAAILLQKALLDKRTAKPLTFAQIVFGKVWSWL